MAFNREADAERRIYRAKADKAQMCKRGWVEVLIPVKVLMELSIPHEPETSQSRYMPRTIIFAPVWVYGVQLAQAQSRVSGLAAWDIVKPLLVATRDSRREQEMVCGEIALDGGVARSVREAARNYIELLHGAGRDDVDTAFEDQGL